MDTRWILELELALIDPFTCDWLTERESALWR